MKAMIFKEPHKDLDCLEVDCPIPQDDEILIKVHACGVCRTDLHIFDGELSHPKTPLILGHEIVGVVKEIGKKAAGFKIGDRVGVPWLGSACGHCEFCRQKKENLCPYAVFTGYRKDGGFAEYTVCKADFAIPLPSKLSDEEMAPLLCAGLIGYRAFKKAAPQKTLGIYGFGAAAHIITQIANQKGIQVYAFTRDGDAKTQDFAKKMGAVWAGGASDSPPELLDAAILFAPAGEHVPLALKSLKKGGRCICGGIHMSDIPSFPYEDLWNEKRIESVANLTREDAREFFELLSNNEIRTEVTAYPLQEANSALKDLKNGSIKGAAVLTM